MHFKAIDVNYGIEIEETAMRKYAIKLVALVLLVLSLAFVVIPVIFAADGFGSSVKAEWQTEGQNIWLIGTEKTNTLPMGAENRFFNIKSTFGMVNQWRGTVPDMPGFLPAFWGFRFSNIFLIALLCFLVKIYIIRYVHQIDGKKRCFL